MSTLPFNIFYTPYIWPSLISAIISIILIGYAWQRRPAPGAAPTAALLVATAIWSLGYTLELGGRDLATKLFWAKFQYPGIVTVPVIWLIFVLQYTNRPKWLTRRNLTFLAIIPLITVLAVWTNEAHGLVWHDTGLREQGPFVALKVTYGLWFWVHTTYSYLVFLLGTLLIFPALFRTMSLYRKQVSILLIAAFSPFIGSLLYLSGLNPFPGLDLTPVSFTITGLAVAWGLFRFQLLDLAPIANRTVMNNIHDGIIVLDTQKRIVNFNLAAKQWIRPHRASKVIGQPAIKVLQEHVDLVKYLYITMEVQAEIMLGPAERRRHFDLSIISLTNQHNQRTGQLIILHDITERKQMAIEQERHRLARDLHDTVIQSLYGIAIAAKTGLRQLDQARETEKVQETIEYILNTAQTSLVETREQIFHLSPIRSDDEKLVEVLAQHCDLLKKRHGLKVDLTTASALSFSADQREALYYIVKEALWNIVKHAQATQVTLSLIDENGHTVLSVIDNGTGFDRSIIVEKEGLGLKNMAERVKLVGGTFEIYSKLGGGSHLTVQLPANGQEAGI